MATTSLDLLIQRLLIKDEIQSIGIFSTEKDVNHHLHQIDNKIMELKINDNEKRDFLFRSLSDDVKLELSALIDYEDNYNSFDYLKKKMVELYSKKKSAVSPYLELMKTKQLPGQSLKEYLSMIRIQGVKVFHNKTPKERECLLVMAFISGLRNTRLIEILKQIKPDTLEKAFDLIKNESNDENFNEANIAAINMDNKCDCYRYRKEIEKLSKEVQEIRNLLKNFVSKETKNFPQNERSFQENRKCFNCGQIGHISRNCRNRPLCNFCGKTGHISQNCRQKRSQGFSNKQNIRNINEETCSNETEVKTIDIDLRGEVVNEAFPCDENDKNIYSLSKPSSSSVAVPKKPLYSKAVENWAQFINGQGNKPKKSYCTENFTKSFSKPTIRSTINGVRKNILMDTGADCNVIDFGFLKKIAENNPRVKIVRSEGNLTCANNSALKLVGYTNLNVKIGQSTFYSKFLVVENISPHVIVGVKMMKRNKISVNPAKSCINIGNSETVFFAQRKSGNDEASN